jgi:hypothetical protein
MYTPGAIIYFTPFYFKNGSMAKPKFFVVLAICDNNAILASLPSSQDHIPDCLSTNFGCVEAPEMNFNCFVLPPHVPVTTCGRMFNKQTFIYGHQLDVYNIDSLKENYRLEQIDYQYWGQMKEAIFDELILCLRQSKSVRKKFIPMLRSGYSQDPHHSHT